MIRVVLIHIFLAQYVLLSKLTVHLELSMIIFETLHLHVYLLNEMSIVDHENLGLLEEVSGVLASKK